MSFRTSKFLRRWFRNWFWIDVLALGTGLISTVLYVLYSAQLSDEQTPYRDVWSNLGSEILGVWISVRIIDGMIGAREERDRVRNAVVGNLNFMMAICQDIPPEYYPWRVNDIGNELRWFSEKQDSARGQEQLAKFFTADERAGIGAVLEEIRAVQSLIGPMQSLRGQFQDLADTDLSWDGPAEIRTLIKRVRRLNEGHPEGEAEIERRRKEVLLNLDQGKYTGEQVGAATRLAELAEKLPSLQMGMKQAISKVESSLVHLRRRMSEEN